MKKLIAVFALLTIIAAASTTMMSSEAIEKLLNFSVKKIITEQIFDKVWENGKRYDMNESFHGAYHSVRGDTYKTLGYDSGDGFYSEARTLIIARVKKYFSEEGNLKDLYLEIRPKFRDKFSKLDEEEKNNLQKNLITAKSVFLVMCSLKHQKMYMKWYKGELMSAEQKYDEWLSQNLSAKEIAERMKTTNLDRRSMWDIEDEVFKPFGDDRDMAKFAGRRFVEGGEPLLRQYLEVIDLVLEDIDVVKK